MVLDRVPLRSMSTVDKLRLMGAGQHHAIYLLVLSRHSGWHGLDVWVMRIGGATVLYIPFGLSLSKPAHTLMPALRQAQCERIVTYGNLKSAAQRFSTFRSG